MPESHEKKKQNICMIAYTNYAIDARVRREAETLASLPEYRVTMLVNKRDAQPRNFSLEGVQVKELNVAKYRGNSNIRYLFSYIYFLLHAFMVCTTRVLNKSLDIVHVHNMPNFLVLAAILPKLFGKKIILDIHDTVLETYSCKFSTTSIKWLILSKILYMEEYLSCLLADRVICVNHIQRDILLKRGIADSKITVLLNVPDPKRFPYDGIRVQEHTQSNGFRLVYFGTIAERLGIDIAIQAVARLVEKIPYLEFHIIGEGDQKQDLLKLARDLHVEHAIRFSEGSVPLEDLAEHLENMDLTIVPNKRNVATELMLPVKMLESIALGIPVVTSRLKTIEYYFDDDTVFYFEPENVDSLALSICNAYDMPSLRADKSSKAKSFLDSYGWNVHKVDLFNLYKSLFR